MHVCPATARAHSTLSQLFLLLRVTQATDWDCCVQRNRSLTRAHVHFSYIWPVAQPFALCKQQLWEVEPLCWKASRPLSPEQNREAGKRDEGHRTHGCGFCRRDPLLQAHTPRGGALARVWLPLSGCFGENAGHAGLQRRLRHHHFHVTSLTRHRGLPPSVPGATAMRLPSGQLLYCQPHLSLAAILGEQTPPPSVSTLTSQLSAASRPLRPPRADLTAVMSPTAKAASLSLSFSDAWPLRKPLFL